MWSCRATGSRRYSARPDRCENACGCHPQPLKPWNHCLVGRAAKSWNTSMKSHRSGSVQTSGSADHRLGLPTRLSSSVPHNCVARIGIRCRSVGGDHHHGRILAVRIPQPWHNEPRPDGPKEPVRLQMDTSLTTRSESGAHGRLPRARRGHAGRYRREVRTSKHPGHPHAPFLRRRRGCRARCRSHATPHGSELHVATPLRSRRRIGDGHAAPRLRGDSRRTRAARADAGRRG